MKSLTFLIVIFPLLFKSYAADISFYGDLMLSRGIQEYVSHQGTNSLCKSISVFLSNAAANIVNLEGCLTSENIGKIDTSLCFRIQPALIGTLKGFRVVSLENNHSLDAGPAGLQSTVEKLHLMNIVALSGKCNYTIIKTDQGNVGIVAATDVLNDNSDHAYVTMADSPEVLDKIRRLTNTCSAVIVYVHWGRELLPVATDRMRKLSASYIDAGADIVIGAHPHVIGPVESINGRPVVYSLGNFLFDQKYPITKKGAILGCEINDNGILKCKLSSCETPLNSFIPQPSTEDLLKNENKTLLACARQIRRQWTGVFTNDRREKSIVLRPDSTKRGLWRIEIHDTEKWKLESVTPPMPVRKLQPVDLDNNGIDEIMLIQSIYSKFDKETTKRIYIYSFKNGFHALWRGTALSRPLIDATFVKNGSKTFLAALHSSDSFLLRNKNCTGRIVTFYRWNGFGFSGVREIRVDDRCDGISTVPEGIRVSFEGITKREISIAEISEVAGGSAIMDVDKNEHLNLRTSTH